MTTENQDAVLIPASSIISTLLSDDGSSTDIRSLISTSPSTITTQSTRLDSQLFNSLPTTLSSHSSLQESLSTLSNLHNLLSSFSTSLSSASSQISVLQQRSSLIDKRLKARERLERRLNDLLNNIALQPEVVKIIFDTKPLPGKDGKDEINHQWLMAIDKLDKVLQATSDLSTIQSLKKGKDKEVDALSEARNVAEACRIVVSTNVCLSIHVENGLESFMWDIEQREMHLHISFREKSGASKRSNHSLSFPLPCRPRPNFFPIYYPYFHLYEHQSLQII